VHWTFTWSYAIVKLTVQGGEVLKTTPESEEEKHDKHSSRQAGMQKELQQLHQNGDHIHL